VSTKNKQKYNKIDRVFGHATLPVVCFLATVLVPVQLLRSTVLMLLRGLARRPMNHDEMIPKVRSPGDHQCHSDAASYRGRQPLNRKQYSNVSTLY